MLKLRLASPKIAAILYCSYRIISFNIQRGKPSVGQSFENEAFGIEVSVSSKLSFPRRFLPVEVGIQEYIKIPLVVRFPLADVTTMSQTMGTGTAKVKMVKANIENLFVFNLALLLETPCFDSYRQIYPKTDFQLVVSVVSCKELKQGLIMGHWRMFFICNNAALL